MTSLSLTGHSLPWGQWWRQFLAFLGWWRYGLISVFPERIQRVLNAVPPRVVVEMSTTEIRLYRELHDGCEEIGRQASEGLDLPPSVDEILATQIQGEDIHVVLRLPSERALATTISLPLATEENLRQVLEFEMDRHTPFSPDQVFFDYYIQRRQPELARVQVRLVLVPQRVVRHVVEQVCDWGIQADIVDVIGETTQGINLLPPERLSNTGQAGRRVSIVLATIALVLLVISLILPLWTKRAMVVDLMPQVDIVKQQAEVVGKLRTQVVEAVETTGFLRNKRVNSPVVIELLDELSSNIPDNTWVQRFELRGQELSLRGESAEASALIQLIEASPMFEGVHFKSSITQNRKTGLDRFHVGLKVIPGVHP